MRATLAIALALGFLIALFPITASAEETGRRGDVILRVRGDVHVQPGESVGSVIVVDGNALVQGTVSDRVVVIRGNAVIEGTVEGDVTVINGSLRLTAASRIENAYLLRSDFESASGATVTGEVRERERIVFRGFSAVASILLWVAMTLAVVVAGLIFAAVGGRQLTGASNLLTERVGESIVATLALWIGAPILAVVAIVTLIGIPLGIGLLIFVLPALFFLGYIVVGTRLGTLVLGSIQRPPGDHPYLAALIGIVSLQIAVLVPVVGWLVFLIAGLWGAGGLAYYAFRAARGRTTTVSA
jgi:hypothetical protein